MPVQSCTIAGRPGYRWGEAGRCYPYTPGDERSQAQARAQAERQGRAIEAARQERRNQIEAVAWYSQIVRRQDGAEPPVRWPVALDVTKLPRARQDARRAPAKRAPYSHAIEQRYERLLLRWVDRMAATMQAELFKALDKTEIDERAKRRDSEGIYTLAVHRHDTAAGDLRALLRVIGAVSTAALAAGPSAGDVRTIGADMAAWSDRAATEEIAALLGVELTSVRAVTPALVRGWTTRNAMLIRTLQGRYVSEVSALARLVVTEGKSTRWFRKRIEQRWGVSRSRAQLIARDQAAKLNSQVTEARQRSLGVKRYRWITSGDDRVRDEHAERNGQIFSWDEPPEDGHPGDPIACRCSASALIDEPEE